MVPLAAACLLSLVPQGPEPFPHRILGRETVARWDFDPGEAPWQAVHDAETRVAGGVLHIESGGEDPYLHGSEVRADGELEVALRLRSERGGSGQLFWATEAEPAMAEARSARFTVPRGSWVTLEVPLGEVHGLRRLRFDPCAGRGVTELDWLSLRRVRRHPLQVVGVEQARDGLRVRLRSAGGRAVDCELDGKSLRVAGEATATVVARGVEPFEELVVAVHSAAPPLEHVVHLHHAERPLSGPSLRAGALELALHGGRGARVLCDGHLAAVLYPLASRGGRAVALAAEKAGDAVVLRGEGIVLRLSVKASGVTFALDAEPEAEGPVVHTVGRHEEALLAGLELLSHGEASSSTLDVETRDHLRYEPDPMLVTMPVMAAASAGEVVALGWNDPSLQPCFAAPDVYDGSPATRMSLRGRHLEGELLVAAGGLDDAIAWAARRTPLPPLPAAPRDEPEQRALCLAALRGPLAGDNGWGHCAEPRWPRRPFADQASALWRLTGSVPAAVEDQLVPGGAHLRDDVVWFASGRAAQWLAVRRDELRRLLGEQRPDGSFRYRGRFGRGHFEDTASGYCGLRAMRLLQLARELRDREALAAGLRALAFCRRFRIPRGAQTWEVPLHTPDILAAAHLTRACVRAFELTGDRGHLEQARRWALRGLPFVYLWSCRPTMAYATVPVYGATDWRAPVWFGRPVQWCGIDYGYALALLAAHDASFDWRRIASGILRAAERMQYPAGPDVGCLPDVFELRGQQRAGPSINPCAVLALARALRDQPVGPWVAVGAQHTVVAAAPIELDRDGLPPTGLGAGRVVVDGVVR